MIRPIASADAAPLHHFLFPAEIDGIEPDVAAYLAGGQGLWTLEAEGRPVGFLGLDDDELAALSSTRPPTAAAMAAP